MHTIINDYEQSQPDRYMLVFDSVHKGLTRIAGNLDLFDAMVTANYLNGGDANGEIGRIQMVLSSTARARHHGGHVSLASAVNDFVEPGASIQAQPPVTYRWSNSPGAIQPARPRVGVQQGNATYGTLAELDALALCQLEEPAVVSRTASEAAMAITANVTNPPVNVEPTEERQQRVAAAMENLLNEPVAEPHYNPNSGRFE